MTDKMPEKNEMSLRLDDLQAVQEMAREEMGDVVGGGLSIVNNVTGTPKPTGPKLDNNLQIG